MESKAFPEGHFVHALAHEVERRKGLCYICQKVNCGRCKTSSAAFLARLPTEKVAALKTFMQLQVLASSDTKVARRIHWGSI